MADGPEDAVVSNVDASGLTATTDLGLRYVHVRADVAGHLFQEAVARAQASLAHLLTFDRQVGDVQASMKDASSKDDAVAAYAKFLMAQGELDRAFRAGATGVVLAVAAAEAQANDWAHDGGGWHGHEDGYPVQQKLQLLAERDGHDLPLGEGILHELAQVVRSRKELVHASGAVRVLGLTAHEVVEPSRAMSLDARRACWTVRRSLVNVARLLGYDLPPYLAYCPPCPPESDTGWSGAVVMTGARDDPDFPPIRARSDESGGGGPGPSIAP
jgi:hypothetical protein